MKTLCLAACAAIFLVVLLSASSNAAQPPSQLVTMLHGYKLTISGVRWQSTDQTAAALTFNFTIQHPDGTPVQFKWTGGAVKVAGWSDNLFDATISHTADAGYDSGSQVWAVSVPGIDPRDKVAHLEFDIRDPATVQTQTTQLNSDIQFNDLPLPTRKDTIVPLNESFTSKWGTVISLKGITYSTQNNGGGMSPLEKYDFAIDHSKIPDDAVQIQFERAFDNGISIDNMWQTYAQPSTAGFLSTESAAIQLSLHKKASLEFSIRENAYSPIKSIVWTPLQIDLPLTKIPAPSGSWVDDESSTKQVDIEFKLQHVAGNNPYTFNYLIWTESADPSKIWRVKKVDWTAAPGAQPWQMPQSNLTDSIYWHADGSMIGLDEHGSSDQLYGGHDCFPLVLTAEEVNHSQHILLFHKIPVPSPGQTIILKRLSETASQFPIRLKSISLNKPDTAPNPYSSPDPSAAYTLQLTFQYVDYDKSEMSLAVIAARDGENNSLTQSLLAGAQGTGDPGSVDPNQRIFHLSVPLPPHGSPVINLKLLATKDVPVGSDLKFSVDKSGKWTRVDPNAPAQAALPAPLPAPTPPTAQTTAAPIPPAPIISNLTDGYQIKLTNAHWDNNNLPYTGLDFNFALIRSDGTPVEFANPDGAIFVRAWPDSNYENGIVRSSAASTGDGGQTWGVGISEIDPRSKTLHLEFDIRDPNATSSQTTNITSDVRLANIPLSAKPGMIPAHQTFTSDWGTVFTLTDVALDAQTQYGQQGTRFDFTVDHSTVPDDIVTVQFEKAFDNGVSLDNLYQFGSNATGSSQISTYTASIVPGTYSNADFEFSLSESAFTPIKSLSWTPVYLDLPLSTPPLPAHPFKPTISHSTKIGDVTYTFELIRNPQQYNADAYTIWTQSADPANVCRITQAFWKPTQLPGGSSSIRIVFPEPNYWHSDGTAALPGEFGGIFQNDGGQNDKTFPLLITAQKVKRSEQLASFSNIPIPAEGKSLILNLKPDNATLMPFRLRAISWKKSMDGTVDHDLTLTFEYDSSDNSLISAGVATAVDDRNNALCWSQGSPYNSPAGAPVGDSDLQTITVKLAVPPQGSKLINLTLTFCKDTVDGPSTNISVSEQGDFTVIPD
jgi:hypothetical protein